LRPKRCRWHLAYLPLRHLCPIACKRLRRALPSNRPGRITHVLEVLYRPADLLGGHLYRHYHRRPGGDDVMPIAQYPNITPPQIQVSTTYPGANAETVSQNVASPIELQVNGADGMLYMYSTNTAGNMTLSIFFDINKDPALAQTDVLNRVNTAMPQLPQSVRNQGVNIQQKSQSIMMVVAIKDPDNKYDLTTLSTFANIIVLNEVQRIPGASMATVGGNPNYAMRVWLDPTKLALYKLTTSDIADAVRAQNQQYAVGQLGQLPSNGNVIQNFSVTTNGMLQTPEEFENIIVKAGKPSSTPGTEGAIVRLRDIGRAELGSQTYNFDVKTNQDTAALLLIYFQPGYNALNVAQAVKAKLEELKPSFHPAWTMKLRSMPLSSLTHRSRK
jgi:multidrug efflux pump